MNKGNIFKTGEASPTKIGIHAFHINLYLHEFSEWILFFDSHESMVQREISAVLRQMKKGQNLGNRKCLDYQNWFPCIPSFLCQPLLAWIFKADSILWPPWTIDYGPKGNFDCFETNKKGQNLRNQRGLPTKIGFHAFHVNLYLYKFLRWFYFLTPMDYIVHGPKRKF